MEGQPTFYDIFGARPFWGLSPITLYVLHVKKRIHMLSLNNPRDKPTEQSEQLDKMDLAARGTEHGAYFSANLPVELR